MDGQGLLRLVLESQVVAIAGAGIGGGIAAGGSATARAAGDAVRAVADGDGLRSAVQHIAGGHTGLHHDHGAVGHEAGDGGGAVLPGGAGRQHIPAAVLYGKRGVGDGPARHGIQLGDGEGAKRLIEKNEGLRVLRVDGDGLCLRTGVHDVAGGRLDLLGDNRAHQAGNADFSLIVRGIEAVAGGVAVVGIHKPAACDCAPGISAPLTLSFFRMTSVPAFRLVKVRV